MVFSNIEVRVKRAGPSVRAWESGGDGISVARWRIRSGPFEREGSASVDLVTTEARFMPD